MQANSFKPYYKWITLNTDDGFDVKEINPEEF